MSDWNEYNFLERLAPQLRLKIRSDDGFCPDANTLCAVIEGEAPQLERDRVMAHLSQCAGCSDLQSRLLNFEQEIGPEPETAWNQTRTRLDNWLEGFLRSEAARSHTPQKGRPTDRVSIGESLRTFFTPRKIVWALSVAAGLVLILDSVLFLHFKRGQAPQLQVATRLTVPPKPPSTVVPAQIPPGKITEKTPAPSREKGLPKAAGSLNAKPESSPKPKVSEPVEPTTPAVLSPPAVDHNQPTETAQATVPSQKYQGTRGGVRPMNPVTGGPPMASASARAGSAMPAGQVHPGPPALRSSRAMRVEINPPPTLWLDPAARLLIVVSSIHIDPDGSFQFRGTLLLPVAQRGPIPIDKGAEVVGAGTMSQGQTSLAVTELDVQGVRYRLKDGTGAMNAQTPGGSGMDFHRSQVLDMWPAAKAVYEKVSDPVEPSGPQK